MGGHSVGGVGVHLVGGVRVHEVGGVYSVSGVQSDLVSDRTLLVIRPRMPKMTSFSRVTLDTHYR